MSILCETPGKFDTEQECHVTLSMTAVMECKSRLFCCGLEVVRWGALSFECCAAAGKGHICWWFRPWSGGGLVAGC